MTSRRHPSEIASSTAQPVAPAKVGREQRPPREPLEPPREEVRGNDPTTSAGSTPVVSARRVAWNGGSQSPTG